MIRVPLSFICVTEDMSLIMHLHMSLKRGSSLSCAVRIDDKMEKILRWDLEVK